MSPPPGTLAPIQTRKFAILPSQTLPASTRSGSKQRKAQQAAKRHPKTTSKSRFRFPFVPILRPSCVPRATMRRFYTTYTMFTIDTTTASGQPVRFLSGADHDGDPTGLVSPSLYPIVLRARSSPPPLPSPIPSNDDRSTNHSRTSYAFVEFRSTRDAEDAYNDMYVPSPRMSPLSGNSS